MMRRTVCRLLRLRRPFSLKSLILLLIITVVDVGISILANFRWQRVPGRIIFYFGVLSTIALIQRQWRRTGLFPSETFVVHTIAVTYYALAAFLPLSDLISYLNQLIVLLAMGVYWVILVRLRWSGLIEEYIDSELDDKKLRVSTTVALSLLRQYHSIVVFMFVLMAIGQIIYAFGYVNRPENWFESMWHVLIGSHIFGGFDIPVEKVNGLGKILFAIVSMFGIVLQAVLIAIFIKVYERVFYKKNR